MAELVPWPIIARRSPPGAACGAFAEPAGNVVELQRIRALWDFLARCREAFGRQCDSCR